jgi:hypothetical protein
VARVPHPIIAVSLLSVLASPTLHAQRSVVQGTVIDSVRGGVLTGAYVELVPGGRQVPTNARGFFRFDNVAAGETYELRVMHALLDTVGVALITPRFTVAQAEVRTVDVSVPSPSRIVRTMCDTGMLARGPAALIGFVRDPDTGAPVDSVEVSLVYDDSPTDLAKSRTVRTARPDASGRYSFCGLPARLAGRVQLNRNGVTSAEIPVALTEASSLALRAFGMSRSTRRVVIGRDSGGKPIEGLRGDGMLVGRVTNNSGQPLAGAIVQVDRSAATGLTNNEGRFRLDGVPSGTQLLRVRKIGYSAAAQAVEIGGDAPPVTVAMADYVPSMPTVVTRSNRNRDLQATGFTKRRERGVGFFLEGDQIDRGPPTLGEALRMIPGLTIGTDAQNQRTQKTLIMSSRDTRTCVRYVVDGALFQEVGGEIEKVVRPSQLEALEMYTPANVPMEFAGASRGRCNVLVLWTNHKIRKG